MDILHILGEMYIRYLYRAIDLLISITPAVILIICIKKILKRKNSRTYKSNHENNNEIAQINAELDKIEKDLDIITASSKSPDGKITPIWGSPKKKRDLYDHKDER